MIGSRCSEIRLFLRLAYEPLSLSAPSSQLVAAAEDESRVAALWRDRAIAAEAGVSSLRSDLSAARELYCEAETREKEAHSKLARAALEGSTLAREIREVEAERMVVLRGRVEEQIYLGREAAELNQAREDISTMQVCAVTPCRKRLSETV